MDNNNEGTSMPLYDETDPIDEPVKEDNAVATIFKVIAGMIWGIGGLADVIWIFAWASDRYYDDLVWVPIAILPIILVNGFLFMGFGELIELLQKIYATMKNDIRERDKKVVEENTAKE